MSVIQQNTITCQCGSSIKNEPANIRQHQKTLKHIKYIEKENIVENKDNLGMNEMNKDDKIALPSANALRVRNFRAKQKANLGEEKYKELMRLDKQKQRLDKKAKDDVKAVEEGKPLKATKSEKKQTKEQVAQYVSNLLSDLDTTKVYNKPAVVQMVKQKLKKFDTTQGAKINCEQLIQNLDKSSLVNSKYGEIKEKSLRDYLANIKLVYTYMTGGDEMDCSDFNWARDIPRVYKAIQEMPNTRFKKNGKDETSQQTKTKRLTAFKSILERLDGFHNEAKEYKKLQDESQKLVDAERGQNKLTERESQNWMEWNDIVKYDDKTWTDEDRLLHALYTCLPPRRLEYGLLLHARHKSLPETQKMDTNFNYLVTNKNDNPTYIVLNKYKTDYKYGQYIINLNDPNQLPLFNYKKLSGYAKALLTNEKIIHKDPIFPNTKGELYLNSSFGRRINYVFRNTGKNISVDILRHSFITSFLGRSSFSTLSDNTLQEVASALGHSAGMLLSYRKLSPEKRIEAFLSSENQE